MIVLCMNEENWPIVTHSEVVFTLVWLQIIRQTKSCVNYNNLPNAGSSVRTPSGNRQKEVLSIRIYGEQPVYMSSLLLFSRGTQPTTAGNTTWAPFRRHTEGACAQVLICIIDYLCRNIISIKGLLIFSNPTHEHPVCDSCAQTTVFTVFLKISKCCKKDKRTENKKTQAFW